jgi:glycosyltransferase involved in cell wall biosynthesis
MIVSRPVRLGVVFDDEVLSGGGFQQSLNAALLARELPDGLAEVMFFTSIKDNLSILERYGIHAEIILESYTSRFKSFARRYLLENNMTRLVESFFPDTPYEEVFLRHRIDLVYFLSPRGRAEDLDNINYLMTVWDLCHRDHPEFPEVRGRRQFEHREKKLEAGLTRASAIFVDSDESRKNIVRRYHVDFNRVHVFPFQASKTIRTKEDKATEDLDINEKYGIDTPYVFYPAQFWAHKNHVYLLEGLRCLEDEYGAKLSAIFSGSDKGNLDYVKSCARNLKLDDRVRFAGFVSDVELRQLYLQSLALVMPTYFGPTNLPPLEAFELGVPVLYPDMEGLREQVQDAALLFDLRHPETLSKCLFDLMNKDGLRETMIEKGKSRVSEINVVDRLEVLKNILLDFSSRRRAWK